MDEKQNFSILKEIEPVILSPLRLKTVTDGENLYTYFWKLWLRGIKQKQTKNNICSSPAKSHFFLNPLTHFIQISVNAKKNSRRSYVACFIRNHLHKNPSKFLKKIKFHLWNWISPSDLYSNPLLADNGKIEKICCHYTEISHLEKKCENPIKSDEK